MNGINAINVSNYFTNRAIDEGRPLTIMQALKLTYIAQGFHLALIDKPFFSNEIEAWKYGPVVRELYEYLKRISNSNYLIEDDQSNDVSFEKRQLDILNVVFGKYANLGAWDLSRLTHEKDTPWERAYQEEETCGITQRSIKKHFKKIVTEYSFAVLLSEISYKRA